MLNCTERKQKLKLLPPVAIFRLLKRVCSRSYAKFRTLRIGIQMGLGLGEEGKEEKEKGGQEGVEKGGTGWEWTDGVK